MQSTAAATDRFGGVEFGGMVKSRAPRMVERGRWRVLAITGNPAAGKSTVADVLAVRLPDWRRLSIDAARAQGEDWAYLARQVRDLNCNAIVESVATPIGYERVLELHRTTHLVVVCDERVRCQRIAARGWPPPPSPRAVRAGYTVDTTNGVPLEELGRFVSGRLLGAWGSEEW